LLVLILNSVYNGQKETSAVSKNTAPITASATPAAPGTILPKYK
jgi:hypothetical protein